jgi:GxxExxY protein
MDEKGMLSDIKENLLKTTWFLPLIESIKTTYRECGHGHREKYYQNYLSEELKRRKIKSISEYPITHYYCKDEKEEKVIIDNGRIDLFVNDEAIIEIKAIVNELRSEDVRQLQNYLDCGSEFAKEIGFCINFPKKYQENLTLLVILNSKSKYLENISTDINWFIFTIRLKVKPSKICLPRDLGIFSL